MAKNHRTTESKQKPKKQPRTRPAATESIQGQVDLADQVRPPEGLIGAVGGGAIESQTARLGDARLQRAQQQALAAHIGRVQGNRHLQRVVALAKADTKVAPFQSRPSKPPIGPASDVATRKSDGRVRSPLSRASAAPEMVMRATLRPDTTEVATVNAAAAPLALMDRRGAGATSLGDLVAGDVVRILERVNGDARIHAETGARRGQIGYVTAANLTVSATPTSLRTPSAGPEDAYALLTAAVNSAPPDRILILRIIRITMTPDQLQRLIQPGNPEYALLQGMPALSATDLLNILNLCGAPLIRKLTDYLDKGGRDYDRLRLAFATANDNERFDVAQDDALVGRLRPILRRTHPEIIFGTVLSRLYPADGNLDTLRQTNPNLGRWLADSRAGEDITAEAAERATGLADAWQTMQAEPADEAHPIVMQAVERAPRGQALPAAERSALDDIEGRAYSESRYTRQNMGAMFLTRWGRPLRNAASRTKTFFHRLWGALKQLPQEHVLLNNVVTYFEENPDAASAGSYADIIENAGTYGQIRYDRPTSLEPLHAASAQSGRVIEVKETHVELYRRGDDVQVAESDGTQTMAVVRSVDARRRRLRLDQSVNVDEDAVIQDLFTAGRGPVTRVTQPTKLYGDNGSGAPDIGNEMGDLQPGVLLDRTDNNTVDVGGVQYFNAQVHAGALRNETGWVRADATTALPGDTSIEMERFAWVVRHEMGHSLDTQVGGFGRFSAVCAARWRKYTGVDDWADDVIAAGVALGGIPSVVDAGTPQPLPAAAPPADQITLSFREAARVFSRAIQSRTTGSSGAQDAQDWLREWRNASPATRQNIYNAVTQFDADGRYYLRNNRGLPALGSRVYTAHYNEWFSFEDAARSESLAVGVPPYAYTCSYEFFAEHYAAYTGPGVAPERYARAVPDWAKNFFDRLAGRPGAGPALGME